MMNDKSIIELLYLAKQNQVDILLNEGQLQLKLPKEKGLDRELLEKIKANKQFILEFLKNNERGDRALNKINKADKSQIKRIPLSFNQEGIWFIDQLEGSLSYHIPSILSLKGILNKDALAFSLRSVVERHEALRTVILSEEGAGYQHIKSANDWSLNLVDASQFRDNQNTLDEFIERLIKVPFNLFKDYMLRAHLLSLAPDDHRLVITMHHIASDGWSASILVRELIELYEAFLNNREPRLKELEIQYSDYAVWQKNYLSQDVLDKKLEYWKQQLAGVEHLNFPTDFTRPSVWRPTGAIKSFSITKTLSDQLQLLSQKQGSTLFMTLLAAFKVLLYRYSDQQDICVGTSFAGRQHKETEDLIGFFINIVALRSNVDGSDSFLNLLNSVKKTTLEAFEQQDVSFGKVVEAVVKERDASRNPLCQVMFVLQNTPEIPELRLGDLALSLTGYEQSTAQYDFIIRITETASGLQGTIQYSTALYKADTIDRLLNNFQVLLGSVVSQPQNVIDSLTLLTDSERNKLLSEFNDTTAPFPHEKTILDLFKEQVAKRPHSPALIFNDKSISYKELDERSNQLAHYLHSKGVRLDTLVPICIERCPEMLVGILGILKAGGAYVPIDPSYPVERILYMLSDTDADVILAGKSVSSKLTDCQAEVIELDTSATVLHPHRIDDLNIQINSDNLCYVIYTSGSTGKPKGVMVEHKGIVNLALSQAHALRLEPGMKTLQFASFGFDASCYEIFNTLLSGGTLVLCNKEDLTSAERIKDLIDKNAIEVAVLPPSYQSIILDSLGTLKTIVSAGEPLNEVTGAKIQKQGVRLINAYGPTENTVCVSLTDNPILEDHVIVIGKPISNVEVYILDKANGVLPIGSMGEICVSGVQVARGYLNRTDLTSEKFVINPFDKSRKSRLYKTGDIGRWLADGNIEYIGRVDEQVKIRGYRIELGEIESVLIKSRLVKQAVVIAKEDTEGHKRLIAYVQPEGEFDKAAVLNYLQTKLPDYMIPAVWIPLENFSLTHSGKIDKKALPDPDQNLQDRGRFSAPQTELEQKLVEVWQDLLEVDNISINDNFFELGGDSILTIQVVSRMRKHGYHLEVTDIFSHQTIAALSSYMSMQAGEAAVGEQGILTGPVGLLPIQQWYFENESTDVSHYNQSVLLSVSKTVAEEQLRQAIETLVLRHDTLRFAYHNNEGNWQQEYKSSIGETPVAVEDLRSKPLEQLSSSIAKRADRYQRSLNIVEGQLLRVVLFKTSDLEPSNRLLIVIHHLVVDGVSWRILLEELENLLEGFHNEQIIDLGNKTSSYRQWYEALKKYGQSSSLISQIPYWQKAADNYRPIPIDKECSSPVKARDTRNLTVKLGQEQTKNLLQEVPRVYHTEINDMLLCAVAKTISEWSKTNNLVIGMEGHGREHITTDIDLTKTVGWFTTLYPLYLNVSEATTPANLIKTVKEQLRQIPDKGLGYGVLRYINNEPLIKNDSWDIQFNYLGQLDNVVRESKLLSVASESTGAGKSEEQTANEKLSINSHIREGALVLNWSYSSMHYNEETIKTLANRFILNLEFLIEHCLDQEKSGSVYTPSDYGLGSHVSYRELDAFLEEDDSDNIMTF